MADNDTLDLLVTMLKGLDARISELDTKVDNMAQRQVTRHEFDAMAARLDTFIIRSEFEQYKALNEQQRSSAVAAVNTRLETLEADKRARGTLPNHWASILAVLAVLGSIGQAIFTYMQLHH